MLKRLLFLLLLHVAVCLECQNFGTLLNGTCACPNDYLSKGQACDYFSCPPAIGNVKTYNVMQAQACSCLNASLTEGFKCSMCTKDESCALASEQDNGAVYVCDKTHRIHKQKHFECLVTDPATSEIVGHLATIQCSSNQDKEQEKQSRSTGTNSSIRNGQTTNNDLGCFLQFWYNTSLVSERIIARSTLVQNRKAQAKEDAHAIVFEEMISCSMKSCVLTEQSDIDLPKSLVRYTCSKTNCTCMDGSSYCSNFVRAIINNMRGSAYIECDRSLHNCLLHHDNLEADIEMSCKGAECIRNGTARPDAEPLKQSILFLIEEASTFLIMTGCGLLMIIALVIAVLYEISKQRRLSEEYKSFQQGMVTLCELSCADLAFASKVSKWQSSTSCTEAVVFLVRFLAHNTILACVSICRVPKRCLSCCFSSCSRRERTGTYSDSGTNNNEEEQGEEEESNQGAFNDDSSSNGNDPSSLLSQTRGTVHSAQITRVNRELSSKQAHSKKHDSYWYKYDVRLWCINTTFKTSAVTGIMGLTGCGKTTLLSLLAGCEREGIKFGSVQYGTKEYQPSFKKFVGYVRQDDNGLNRFSTVREEIKRALDMKSYLQMEESEKSARVDAMLEAMGLDAIADSIIGSLEEKRTSGGQRRRISIAKEMIWGPAVLLLDEPTSGLDAATSSSIMRYIKAYSWKTKATVILTVHSPSEQVFFDCLDELLLLDEAQVIYKGPPSEIPYAIEESHYEKPSDCTYPEFIMRIIQIAKKEKVTLKHLAKHAPSIARSAKAEFWVDHRLNLNSFVTKEEWKQLEAEMHLNERSLSFVSGTPSSIETTTTAVNTTSNKQKEGEEEGTTIQIELQNAPQNNTTSRPEAASFDTREDLKRKYFVSKMHLILAKIINPWQIKANSSSGSYLGIKEIEVTQLSEHYSTILKQSAYLYGRMIKNFYRSSSSLAFNVLSPLAASLFIGSLVFRPGIDNESSHTKLGAMFWMCIVSALLSAISIGRFTEERAVYFREQANGYYSARVYYTCTILFDIFFFKTVSAFLLTLPAYLMIGLRPGVYYYVMHSLVVFLFSVICGLTSVIISSIFHSETIANAVSSVLVMFGSLFAGSMINRTKLHIVTRAVMFLSHWNYAYQALVVNEFYKARVILNIKGIDIPGLGDYWINFLGMDSTFQERKVLALLLICVLYALLGMVVFTKLVKERL